MSTHAAWIRPGSGGGPFVHRASPQRRRHDGGWVVGHLEPADVHARRDDLVDAVEVDACAAQGPKLAATHDPDQAWQLWIEHYAAFIATKRGLAAALHHGDPAFQALPAYFQRRLGPVLQTLLDGAVAAGAIRDGVDPLDLLGAVAKLCIPPLGTDDTSRADRMIALLLDGLRYGADPGSTVRPS